MKRFYYLSDDIESTDRAYHQLEQSGTGLFQLHVAGSDCSALKAHHLEPPNIFQAHEIVEDGIFGALSGLCIGIGLFVTLLLAQTFFQPFSLNLFGVVIVITLIIGALAGGLYGLKNENHHLSPFHDAIHEGKFLLMVDTTTKNENIVDSVVKQYRNIRGVGSESISLPSLT
ncbi:MAG: hypothetical protein V3T17_18400 [Pseudomonadales bacterium]